MIKEHKGTILVLNPDEASRECIEASLLNEFRESNIKVETYAAGYCLERRLEQPEEVIAVITEEHLEKGITGTKIIKKYQQKYPDVRFFLYTSDCGIPGEKIWKSGYLKTL